MNTRTRTLLLATALLVGGGAWLLGTHRTRTVAAPRASTASPAVVRPFPTHAAVAHPAPAAPVAAPRAHAAPSTRPRAVQGLHRLPVQRYTVQAQRDTLLRTAGGCTVHVPANTFVHADGKPVNGAVAVQVQEALTPADLLLGGLCTVYQGKALESGGSFSITATAAGRAVELAKDAALSMAVPSRMQKAGMKLFPGTVKDGAVEWQEPGALQAPVARARQEAVDAPALWPLLDTLTTNVTYRVEGFADAFDAPMEVTRRVSDVAWADGGLMLKRDSTFTVGAHTVHFFANERPTSTNVVPVWQGDFARQGASVAGLNTFQEDPATNYIFQVKRLGWANIDRLLHDKRTRPVDLVTTITEGEGLEDVRISLVMKGHNLYLPGYQRADGGYGFSHGDFERMELPVGAKATVVATARRKGAPCYALQEFVIAPTGRVQLHLQPTTDDGLRAALMEAL